MDEALTPEAQQDLRIFKGSLPLRVRLDEIIRAQPKTEGASCLEVGIDNGVMSRLLRKRGGEWYTVVSSEAVAARVRALIPDNVFVMEKNTLPFRKKVFDTVIVANMDLFDPHDSFVEECHRILKPDGRLILIAANRKPFSMLPAIRRLLGPKREDAGLAPRGHTESELFSILKHGFDVHSLRKFSRFFLELTDAIVHAMAIRLQANPGEAGRGLMRLYTFSGFFYGLAAQLDMLLLFTRGHYLIVTAKRRAWRPRRTPVLADGRTIPEAVLSRAPK